MESPSLSLRPDGQVGVLDIVSLIAYKAMIALGLLRVSRLQVHAVSDSRTPGLPSLSSSNLGTRLLEFGLLGLENC